LDSGTKVTSLPKSAYKVFRNSFIAQAGNLTWASKKYVLDTCYNISYGADSINVPSVSFHFSIKPIQTRLGGCKHFCHAFAPSNTTFSIIGNTQLAGIQISIDTIARHVCLRPFSIIPIHEHNNMMMAVVVSRSCYLVSIDHCQLPFSLGSNVCMWQSKDEAESGGEVEVQHNHHH
jgi:hypothetical protein